MKPGVTHKLFLTLFLAAGLAVASSTVIMDWSLNRGFIRYIDGLEATGLTRLASMLEERYRADSGWDLIRRDPITWRRLLTESMPDLGPPPGMDNAFPPPPAPDEMLKNAALDGRRENGPPPGALPPHLIREFDERLFLQDARKTVIIGSPEASANAKIVTLYHQNKVIGYVGIHQKTMLLKRPHQRFLEEQKIAFAIVAGVIVFLSAGLSLLLATRMVRPLKKISTATHLLAQGEYSVRVPVDSNDELGRLATDFNALALAMEHNEQARRRWVADISHELRTPLTFLRSQVEAILDGIRQPSVESIQAIHHEILRFSRLVDDLYQLSMSDVGALTYRKEEAVVTDILTEAVSMLRPAFSGKNIALHCKGTEEAITVFGDKERLGQLLGNLLDNSLKYTDPGGVLRISISKKDNRAVIDFQDSAPGVPEAELGKLFERLYRVESSRSRVSGGAGLGLTICRNIVEAHAGTIEAKTSPLGGVWIHVVLPCCGRV